MILADTSIWIEFLRGRPGFSVHFRELLEQQQVLGVECVFGELLQGARNAHETNVITTYWQHLPKHDETGLWLAAGMLSASERLFTKGVGLIDAVLLAAARKFRLPIWTLDKKLLAILRREERYNNH